MLPPTRSILTKEMHDKGRYTKHLYHRKVVDHQARYTVIAIVHTTRNLFYIYIIIIIITSPEKDLKDGNDSNKNVRQNHSHRSIESAAVNK